MALTEVSFEHRGATDSAARTPPGASTTPPKRRKKEAPLRSRLLVFAFFVPLLLAFGLFSWWPIVQSLLLSLQQTNFITTDWVGLENFQRVLADPLLQTAVLNTVAFTLLALLIGFPVPLLLAVFLGELRKLRGPASVLAYVPVIIPPVVAVLLWKSLYQPGPGGVFNSFLGLVGIGPFAWLNDANLALPAIVVQATWASFGTATIIYLAALLAVPPELYEAAEIDGAGVLQRVWHVTLPQLRPVILVLLLLQLVGTVQIFTEPYVMTGGGPENRTMSILMLIYRYAFVNGDFGKATSLSLMLAIALGILSALFLLSTRRWSRA
ncbi:carbohydrate ABC transporter permease [Subtercola endophyticus]|uniref:carbohydrate ABC transporter permease n=1 Tax=Subtercola endophyticus TaxID=2895559 RepID=UPI001E4EECC6|nr:sugar ABC transporter permease [Subtercola endophyticus]UFS60839.1 sugar ABC transporter permease [Subtercola endophyticus]